MPIDPRSKYRHPSPPVPNCNTSTTVRQNSILGADASSESLYVPRMNLSCLFGVHRPSLASILRRQDGYAALCEGCGRPLERRENERWTASEPLYERTDHAA